MAKTAFSFVDCIEKISSTPPGKEAAMYGPLRDLFINVLHYEPATVDIDTTGDTGRPDVTVSAPSGLVDSDGKPVMKPWIVVEAKDEQHAFSDPVTREQIFAEKSKYIGANTAWFVMVDPTCWIARPVGGKSSGDDIVVNLKDSLDLTSFTQTLNALRADFAGVSEQLKRFRSGDEDLIAYESLDPPLPDASQKERAKYRLTRKRFFANLRDATEHLQDACARALQSHMPEVNHYWDLRNAFCEKYGGKDSFEFNTKTLLIRARPQGPVAAKQHDNEAKMLRKEFAKSPAIARLALDSLPQFQARTGAENEKLQKLFAIESANLILARVLLLRFFEDHGFFQDKMYLCNGGVEAFQRMKDYFDDSYVGLLEHAYRRASRLYAAAFDETELDWIFTDHSRDISNAVEWVLFQFARYDFRTVRGDILTGIYDRFLDRSTRKELGEFYTPPSIARYMIERVDLKDGDYVLDPACGSGTFLIESYRKLVGDDVERGVAEWGDVVSALSRICGNDLNTFSSVIAQIQLLWQILRFKDDIEKHGLPELQITGKVNSLQIPDQMGALEKFGEIDSRRYAAVVGNPPFVRTERSAQQLDERTIREFEGGAQGHAGISGKLNSYALFLYRALHSWALPAADNGEQAGRVAFVVQVSLFDSNETADLRRLFLVGGRWTIREIVDLELIYRDIFDADVLPAIIVCENRPATEDDFVSIRIGTKSCVKPHEDGTLPTFDLASLGEQRIAYKDIFTPDGRILTRLTAERAVVIGKLWLCERLSTVAKRYWVSRSDRRTAASAKPADGSSYEERRMLAGGIAFRGSKSDKVGTLDIYKAENIIAGEVQGEPVLRRCDISEISDPSFWRFPNLLPEKAFAVAQVAHCPNAAPFDPRKVAFTNTATIFVPSADCSSFPFDLLLLARPYVWFYAIAARMGVLRLCRSHIYPTNLGLLPWTNALLRVAPEIEALRDEIISTCSQYAKSRAALVAAVGALKLDSLKVRTRKDPSARIGWGEGLPGRLEIGSAAYSDVATDVGRITLSDDSWMDVSPQPLARGVAKAISVLIGDELSKKEILSLGIPVSDDELALWDNTVASHSPSSLGAARAVALNKLDMMVGIALGLTEAEIGKIQLDCLTDPFLSRIEPRYPGTETRKQGFRTGLGSSERYQ